MSLIAYVCPMISDNSTMLVPLPLTVYGFTDRVKGKSIDEVLTIKNSDIAKHLSLPPVKLHCSMLAEDAIKAAVKDVQAKRAKLAASKQQQQLNEMEQPDSGEKLAAAVAS